MRMIFVFGFMIKGKELLADLKLATFKIWLDTVDSESERTCLLELLQKLICSDL